jgi:hypothetical protein
MNLKTWVLERVHRIGGLAGRGDLPHHVAHETAPEPGFDRPRATSPELPAMSGPDHLGIYAELIAAIREELEHFIVSHVRLHLAIADHDRFLLTSIGVDCPAGGEARMLLQQFMREFKPEQVKRYLSREVIAGLPNASAIDLTQFAGLIDLQASEDPAADDEYADLIDALRNTAPSPSTRSFVVGIAGRWSELDANRTSATVVTPARNGGTPSTPLAGLRCEFDVEDADGRRRVVLQSVIAGRRYIVGKGEGCDIRVNGAYTSRRHGEIWIDQGAWWMSDAGSTNGIRVEWPTGSIERCGGPGHEASLGRPLRVVEGARIVLSAQAQGPASDYPLVALRAPAGDGARVTPIAQVAAAPKTALTPIVAARTAPGALAITAHLASGERRLELHGAALPLAVGRSRNQQLVIDRAHEAVSGHHLDITELDASGAQVVVHGDNGVMVDGTSHAAGSSFRWKPGQTMVLGAGLEDHPACSLVLTRA